MSDIQHPRPASPRRTPLQRVLRGLYLFYQFLVAGPLFVILTFITAIITAVGSMVGNRDFWGYWPPSIWSRITCRLFLMRVVVEGHDNIDPRQSYVFVANHQGAYDIWAIYGYLGHNFKWLMKKELERIFLVGTACRKAGHIMVDDSSVSGIRETIANSEHTLRDGMSLVIFPEGSRSWDGSLSDFKRGAFMLAAEFRLPVVPLTIDGAFKAMPRYTYCMTPTTIRLVIHKPIWPGERGFNTKKLMAQCRQDIEAGLKQEAGA